MAPKVALIWINYNSSHIISVVKESLRSLFEADYPKDRYEIIVVDNASSDASWRTVKKLVEEYSRKYNVKTIFYRSSKNFMYTGGNELGLRLMRRDVEFVGFINNDVIIETKSLDKLIEYLRTYKYVGAVQGILYYDRRKQHVNSAGLFIDTLFNCHMVSITIDKPLSVSYTHGAYSIYSMNAIKKCLHNGRLFFQCVPAFFDDNYIGVRLWNLGYMSCALPIDAGVHLHSSTFRRFSLLREINSFKSLIVKELVIDRDYPPLHNLYIIKKMLTTLVKLNPSTLLRTYIEAKACGDFIVKCLGAKLNIRRMPHIPLTLNEIVKIIIGAGRSVYSRFIDGKYVLSRACLKNLCPT